MGYTDIILDHRENVSWIYFNRPQALNAMSLKCMEELKGAFTVLRDRIDTRVVVLSGKGRAFCAGADLGGPNVPNGEPTDEPGFLDLAAAMEDALNAVEKPMVAAVNGVCCAGGLEMALMCDFIVAAASARIGDAHANFAAMPGGGATARLPRAVGTTMAKYMMFTGDLFSAAQMFEAGLVTRVVEDASLEAEVQALAAKIGTKSPLGLKRMKKLLDQAFDLPLPLAVRLEKLTSAEHMRSWDATEGGRAFIEKRTPKYRGY